MRFLFAVLFVILAASLDLVSATVGQPCPCPEWERCDQGFDGPICYPKMCQKNEDCSSDGMSRCGLITPDQGVCIEPVESTCSFDIDCPLLYYCTKQGKCKPVNEGKPECVPACPDFHQCIDGECVRKDPVIECYKDSDCADHFKCYAGGCVDDQYFCTNVKCAADEICRMDICFPKDFTNCPACQEGQICFLGVCISQHNMYGDCPVCPLGTFCLNGKCLAPETQCAQECRADQYCSTGVCLKCLACEEVPRVAKTYANAGFDVSQFDAPTQRAILRVFEGQGLLTCAPSFLGLFPEAESFSFNNVKFTSGSSQNVSSIYLQSQAQLSIQALESSNPSASLVLQAQASLAVTNTLHLQATQTQFLFSNVSSTAPGVIDFSTAQQLVINGTLDFVSEVASGGVVMLPTSRGRLSGSGTLSVSGGVTVQGVIDLPLLLQRTTPFAAPQMVVNKNTTLELYQAVISREGQMGQFIIQGKVVSHYGSLGANITVDEGAVLELVSSKRSILGLLDLKAGATLVIGNSELTPQIEQTFMGCDATAVIHVYLGGQYQGRSLNFSTTYLSVSALRYAQVTTSKAACSLVLINQDAAGNVVQQWQVTNPHAPKAPAMLMSTTSSSNDGCTAVWGAKELKFECGTAPSIRPSAAATVSPWSVAVVTLAVLSIFAIHF